MTYDFKALLKHCKTSKQKMYIKACINSGSISAAARELGFRREAVRETVKLVRKYAENTAGYAPEAGLNHPISKTDLAVLDGFSDMRTNDEGKPIWYKYSMDKSKQLEYIREMVEELKAELPKYEPIKPPKSINKHLLNHITLTDTYIGDLASKSSGGDTWNLEEADRVICGVVEGMVAESPKADTCILSLLGDIIHYDSALVAETPRDRKSVV